MSKFLCGECIHNGCGCLIPNNLGYVDNCQHYIHKHIPNVEMTNEEYIHSLNTEQLAEYLADKFNEVVDFILHEVDENAEDIEPDDYWYRQDVIVEWLKKPHTKE